MDAITARNLATMIFGLIGAGVCLAYAFTDQRRKAKRPVYGVAGVGFLYVAIIYGMGTFIDHPIYLLRSGWLGAIGQYLLTAAFIAILVTDWRRRKNDGG